MNAPVFSEEVLAKLESLRKASRETDKEKRAVSIVYMCVLDDVCVCG